ncbi:MAG: ferritin-like domain-containing protein [bacterium]
MSQPDAGIFAAVDPEIITAIDNRAGEIAQGASVSPKIAALLALGSVPVALGALARDVYGQAPADVVDALQFALLLEYLEADFYSRGIAATGLILPTDVAVFTTISAHEAAHVSALQTLIQGKGSTPNAKPTFDFTAKGALPGFAFAVGQYTTFTMLAQGFEDLGVRAYKGQIGRLINDKAVLTAALTIHSVEARHAAEVRRLRGKKAWISTNSRDDLPALLQGIYDGEENGTQAGVSVIPFAGTDSTSATEAFDEPLTMAQVLPILTPFL